MDEHLRALVRRLLDEYDEDMTREPSFVTMALLREALTVPAGQETLDLPCSGSGAETQIWNCPECHHWFAATEMRLADDPGWYIIPTHLPDEGP